MQLKVNIEKEIKYMMGKASFDLLIETNSLMPTTQVNYYFDTSEFWCYNNNTTVRIRQKKGEYELTVKQKSRDECLYQHSKESSTIIDEIEFGQYLDFGIDGNQIDIGIPHKLTSIGKLTTHRAKLVLGQGLVIDIDKNEYNDIVDYEIEFEFDDIHDRSVLDEWLTKQCLSFQHSQLSKFERFAKSLLSSKQY